jgi:hypothetical protein
VVAYGTAPRTLYTAAKLGPTLRAVLQRHLDLQLVPAAERYWLVGLSSARPCTVCDRCLEAGEVAVLLPSLETAMHRACADGKRY